MKEGLSTDYPDSGDPICVGDQIEIDGIVGVIERVLLAHTTDANELSCNDTGGILIQSGEYGRVLFPFTFPVSIKKLKRG